MCLATIAVRCKQTHKQWGIVEVVLKLASIQRGAHDDYLKVVSLLHNLQRHGQQ